MFISFVHFPIRVLNFSYSFAVVFIHWNTNHWPVICVTMIFSSPMVCFLNLFMEPFISHKMFLFLNLEELNILVFSFSVSAFCFLMKYFLLQCLREVLSAGIYLCTLCDTDISLCFFTQRIYFRSLLESSTSSGYWVFIDVKYSFFG